MTMVRGQFSQLQAPGLHAEFVHWVDTLQREEEYSHILHVEPSDKAFEDEVEFSGLPPMPLKPEGEATIYQDALQGGTKRYINFTYALGVRSSFELYEDDQYGIIIQVPKAIARSAHFTKEQNAWNLFNLGFTTQITTDGVSIFNNAHPLLGGTAATTYGPGLTNVISAAGTYPNRPATDVDLSFTSVQLMINQFERLVDSQGLPISIKPHYLIIPPELKWIAREILGSPHKPYTADNEINALIKEDLQYFISHYLTSQSAWFAVTEKDGHWLKFLVRKELDEDFSDDFDTFSIKQLSRMRFAVGATTWMGTWGSNGP
jgi:phage major head subunit gpT-like protein